MIAEMMTLFARHKFYRAFNIKTGKYILFITLPCVVFSMSGCGMSTGTPHIQCGCWSPDQSYIIQTLDPKGRLNIWGMDSGIMWPYQELYLRWCSVDDINKPKDVWLKSKWFSTTWIYTPPMYFSQDSMKVALNLNDKITVVNLLSGKKTILKPDQWHPEEWILACESVRDNDDNHCKLQREELPKGVAMGVVSPDGKRTALFDYYGQVVIENKNLKVKP